MDLWEKFEMGKRLAGMWRELGISAGTAIVVLTALYFVIKWAVRNGVAEAYKKIAEQKAQNDFGADKAAHDFESHGNDANGKVSGP